MVHLFWSRDDWEQIVSLVGLFLPERLLDKQMNNLIAHELLVIVKELVIASGYQSLIHPMLVRMGHRNIDPRHVEAYLRLQWGTLDHLSRNDFEDAIPEIVETIRANPRQAEQLADSYGL